jgi:Protein tyrosine and serine/threonine kinase
MGEVWLVEQKTPIHRTVALKLIKAGMETKTVVARFESERQALAMMDHLSIARVFDAGSTAEGRPYFVMEYVPGLAITEYCDKHRLTIKERLELFMQVCEAVQHAHQQMEVRSLLRLVLWLRRRRQRDQENLSHQRQRRPRLLRTQLPLLTIGRKRHCRSKNTVHKTRFSRFVYVQPRFRLSNHVGPLGTSGSRGGLGMG